MLIALSDLVSAFGTNWMYAFSSFSKRWVFGTVGCDLYGFVQVSSFLSFLVVLDEVF